jgi:hypothetical protein
MIGFAATASAQSLPPPTVIGSSEADTGTTGQPYLTMSLPNGVAAGDLLVATVAIQGVNPLWSTWATIYAPAGGWTVASGSQVCGKNQSESDPAIAMSIAWRIAQPGDGPNTEFTWGFDSGGYFTPVPATGSIVAVANVNTASPVAGYVGYCTVDGTDLLAQPLTTFYNNELSLLMYGITRNNFLSKPSGYSQLFQHPVSGLGPDISNDSLLIPNAFTSTGYQTSTASVSGNGFGFSVLVEPEQ